MPIIPFDLDINVLNVTPPAPTPVVRPVNPLWRLMHDPEIYANQVEVNNHGQYYEPGRGWDWRAGYPEVFWLLGSHEVPFDEAWQRLSFAMNPQMQPLKWRQLYDDFRAFMNGTGFPHPNKPGDPDYDPTYVPKPKWDYVNKIDEGSPLPSWDKVRLCGGATIAGVRNGSEIIVDTLDYFRPPTLEWLMARPWLYFHAVSILKINGQPKIDKFPQNGAYPTLVPLVARTQVRVPYRSCIPVDFEQVDWMRDPYKVGVAV